jgi:hypothetical protein
MSGYSSESEDQPREILDLNRDFFIKNSEPHERAKLHEIMPMLNGAKGGGGVAVRPVPDPESVMQAKTAMGNKR